MSEVTWTPEGEKLFEKLLAAVPEAMRETIKPKLIQMLAQRAGSGAIDEAVIKTMVQEDLPEPQKSALMVAIGMQPPPPPPQDGPALAWSGKSEIMFELMLGEVPEGMRSIFRGKLSAVIAQKTQGAPVAEEHVTAVVNEIVPEPFKSNILKKFKTLGDFDPAMIGAIVERFGTSRDKLMFIMHAVQDEIGYLPREAMLAISDKTGIPVSAIYSVASFYKAFRMEKPGTHHVKLCCGTACHIHDTAGTGAAIENKIAASTGVSIEKTLCLGCCDCAPVIEIDGKVYKGAEAQAKIDSITLG